MSNLEVFKDSDDVEIKDGSRLVWASLFGEQSTGIVFLDDSIFYVRISPFNVKYLADIVRYEAWCLVVPAYPRALIKEVA